MDEMSKTTMNDSKNYKTESVMNCEKEISIENVTKRTRVSLHIRNENRHNISINENNDLNNSLFKNNQFYDSQNRPSYFKEIFHVIDHNNDYRTQTVTLKEKCKMNSCKSYASARGTIHENENKRHKYDLKQTFIFSDRVPILHYETVDKHYISGNGVNIVYDSFNKVTGVWNTKSYDSETSIKTISQASFSENSKLERNSEMAGILNNTITTSSTGEIQYQYLDNKQYVEKSDAGISNNVNAVLFTKRKLTSPVIEAVTESFNTQQTAADNNKITKHYCINNISQSNSNISMQSTNVTTGFSDNSCYSTNKISPNKISHVSAATLTSAIPIVGSNIPVISSNKSILHGNSAAISRNVSSAIATSKVGLVPMMVYGNSEQCARIGCGLRWVPRSMVEESWSTIPPKQVMDKDGTLDISFDEWRDYLLFHPSANLQDIILYWRHATTLDIGEDLSVPDDFSHEEWVSGKWWRHLVAGGVAGMVSRTCTAPLDRLKVFLQVHGPKEFKTLRSCFKYMLDEGGVKSLWRGNGINVLKIAPESALKFAAYEQAKGFIKINFGKPDRELSIGERFAAGSFAGGFSQSAIYPMEVLKTRMALRKSGQYRGIFDAAKQIHRTEGLRSFYRGYIPNLIGIIPYAGIDLAIYETLKKHYIQMTPTVKEPSIFVIIGCGALSSSCGQIASYPLALIRTRLQAQVMTKGMISTPDNPTTAIGIFKKILRKEGPLGLYRGIAPNFMKVAPAVSISYVCYEKCREALGVSMT